MPDTASPVAATPASSRDQAPAPTPAAAPAPAPAPSPTTSGLQITNLERRPICFRIPGRTVRLNPGESVSLPGADLAITPELRVYHRRGVARVETVPASPTAPVAPATPVASAAPATPVARSTPPVLANAPTDPLPTPAAAASPAQPATEPPTRSKTGV